MDKREANRSSKGRSGSTKREAIAWPRWDYGVDGSDMRLQLNLVRFDVEDHDTVSRSNKKRSYSGE